jgi:peptidyl-dipeptidase A
LRLIPSVALVALLGCGGGQQQTKTLDASRPAVDAFLGEYAEAVKPKWTEWHNLAWKAHTRVSANDTETAELAAEARDAWEQVVGDQQWANKVRELIRAAEDTKFAELERKPPTEVQLEGLRAIQGFAQRYQARAAEERKQVRTQTASLFRQRAAWTYTIERPVEPEAPGDDAEEGEAAEVEATKESGETEDVEIAEFDLLRELATSRDLADREAAWNALMEPAKVLKMGYPRLRDTRNALARRLGHKDHLDMTYETYGMSKDEMEAWQREVEVAVRPLYRELHTWLRYELAERYGAEVPDYIPAHWLGTATTHNLSATLELPNLDPTVGLAERGAEGMVQDAAAFFEGVGLTALSEDFWSRSSLYPRLPDQKFGKLGGASTWNIDLGGDVRVLMSARAEPTWMHATYRELAFAQAQYARADAGLPTSLRMTEPDAVLGGLATWAEIAGTRPARLDGLGLLRGQPSGDESLDILLDDAMTWFTHMPFLVGTVAAFERDVYLEDLPTDQLNTRWWALVKEHQGIVPPSTRTERFADPLRYAALIEHPGSASETAIAMVLGWHLQVTIAESLDADPMVADFQGRQEVGEVFRQLANRSATEDWRAVVEELTGSAPSAEAMARYFQPLQEWLESENDGRVHVVPRLK